MFKKGEYIVCLNTPEDETSFPKNYIFKQRESEDFLRVEKDITLRRNGWSYIAYDSDKGKYSAWRYATKEEIKEYDRLDKPYDVTTLTPVVTNKKEIKEDLSYLSEFLTNIGIT